MVNMDKIVFDEWEKIDRELVAIQCSFMLQPVNYPLNKL